jgi:DNA-binding transcriptional ArsR family regulator
MSRVNTAALSDAHLVEVAEIFAMLSEPSRLKLLRALMQRTMTVTELMKATQMRQGNVSKHLSVLLRGGFVTRVQQGNFAQYHLIDPTVKAICNLMCGRIEKRAKRKIRELRLDIPTKAGS